MFCGKCGNNLPENAKFCDKCGWQVSMPETSEETPIEPAPVEVEAASTASETAPQAPDETVEHTVSDYFNTAAAPSGDDLRSKLASIDAKTPWLKFAVAGGALVLVLVLLFSIVFGSSYTDPIDNVIKAAETGNGKYLEKMIPKSVAKEMEESDVDFDDLAEDMQDEMEDEVGDKFKLKYKITKRKHLDKDEIENLEERLYGPYKNLDIQDAYELDVELKLQGRDGKSKEEEDTITVIKVKGKWYMYDFNF